MVTHIPALPLAHQLLLQRLTAAHVLNESQFTELWNEVSESQASQQNPLGRTLQQTVSLINKSIKPGFGMEIRSISFLLRGSEEGSENDVDDSTTPTKYYAVVNCNGDNVATSMASKLTKSPHELAFLRLILEKLVESSNQQLDQDNEEEKENEEESSDEGTSSRNKKRRRVNRTRGIGCIVSLPRMDLINLRTELTGHHQNKLTIQQTDNCLASLEAEGWLVACINPNGRESSRRRSMGGSSNLQLGPRAYMEFPDFLVKVGLERDHLPQFILH